MSALHKSLGILRLGIATCREDVIRGGELAECERPARYTEVREGRATVNLCAWHANLRKQELEAS